MAKLIPVPVRVKVGTSDRTAQSSETRIFGSFKIVPYATQREDRLEVDSWMLWSDGNAIGLFDKLLFSVLPSKLLSHVCIMTFETERESVPILFIIDDQEWTFKMRARELEPEQVHYQIEIDDEWMSLTDAFIGDIIDEEMKAFAEREVLPNIDFGYGETVYETMT